MQEKNETREKLEKVIPAKLTKNNCLILVLFGILLLVIVWPTQQNGKKRLRLPRMTVPNHQLSL